MDYSDALTEKQWLRVSSSGRFSVSVSNVVVLCILNDFLASVVGDKRHSQFCVNFSIYILTFVVSSFVLALADRVVSFMLLGSCKC